MFELARILLLSAHLLSVNIASGGPVICIALEWRRGSASRDAIRYLAGASLVCLFVGGLLGLVLGMLEWNSEYQSVWTVLLGRKVFFAILEFLFSATLLLSYLFWRKRDESPVWLSFARSLLLFVAATNLLYHFPPLFFNGQRLLDRGTTTTTPLSSADFRQLMFSGETPALTVHVVLASVAVAGLTLAHLALRWRRLERLEDARWAAVSGSRWCLGATLLQLPVGLWALLALPRPMQNELVGSNPVGLILFASSMVAALWLTRELVSIAMGEANRGPLLRAMTAMLLTITLMTASHEIARGKRHRADVAVPATASSQSHNES